MAKAWCLIPELANKFKQAIADGTIQPVKLSEMASAERRAFFEKIVGKEDAKEVNAQFEKKLLLKNKEQGWINWAKHLTGIAPEARRDILARIEKMVLDTKSGKTILNPETEEAFLQDLASKRLGADVTFEEAKKITDLSTKVTETKKGMGKDGTFSSEEARLTHGYALVNLRNYVNDLKDATKAASFKDRINPLSRDFAVYQTPGFAKALKAAFDASALLRQGLKTLFKSPTIWARNVPKTFADIGKQIKQGSKSHAVMDAIKADIYSRPNALNGNYDRFKIAIGTMEEQFPSSLPSKVPLLGRLFTASETAYTGFLYRLRADLADRYIKVAEDSGISVTDAKHAGDIGKLVNTLTGRGSLGKYEQIGKDVNAAFFSIKFLKSNWDTLTAHSFGAGLETSFGRKEAAKNLLSTVVGIGVTLGIADRLFPGSVEWDPRSANFGKIKIGDTRFDISAGMGSILTLAARLATASSKSSSTGVVTPLGTKFGETTPTDILVQFWENKTSPAASLALNLINRSDVHTGQPLTPGKVLSDLLEPLPSANFRELMANPNSAPLIPAMIADGLGISTNTYAVSGNKDWTVNQGVEMAQFEKKVGEDKFKQANADYNTAVNAKILKVVTDPRYKDLSDEAKAKTLTKVKEKVKTDIFTKYNFTYQEQTKTPETTKEARTINTLAQ